MQTAATQPHNALQQRQPLPSPNVTWPPETDGMLRMADVCRRLRVSVPSGWRWSRSMPDFPKAIRLSAGVTVFSESSLEAFIEKRAAGVTPPTANTDARSPSGTPAPTRRGRGRPRRVAAPMEAQT